MICNIQKEELADVMVYSHESSLDKLGSLDADGNPINMKMHSKRG